MLLSGLTPVYRTDRHIITQQTARFFECIKFKEFDEASDFHNTEDRAKADIPYLIEDLFKIPPEYLDIQDYRIVFADTDSSGLLGKAKTRCVVHILNTNEIKRPEVILYWKKEGDNWYLKLRSSLERGGLSK